jgi:hypothetical protein
MKKYFMRLRKHLAVCVRNIGGKSIRKEEMEKYVLENCAILTKMRG